MIIVSHGEIETALEMGDGWLVKPTLDRNGQFRPVIMIANLPVFIPGSHHGSRILATFWLFEIEGNEEVAIRKIVPLGASRPGVFEPRLVWQLDRSPVCPAMLFRFVYRIGDTARSNRFHPIIFVNYCVPDPDELF